jgi:competence protein ComEC
LDDALSVTLFVTDPPVRLGSPPWWQRAAGAVRSALRRASDVLPDADRGLLPGLVDGDTSHLDPVLAERFRLAGLTHLVAVSGTNCSVVLGAVLLLLRRARARPWISALTGATVLVAFVVVARPSPSVVRAAAMAGIALVALALGRPRAALPALAAAVLGLLAWDARLAADPSFTMSVLATTALLTIAPGWAAALRRHGVPVGVAETVAVAAAAHLVTAPVVAAIAGRVSLVAVPANVLAEPVVAVTTVLGFAAALVAPLWLGAGSALAWLAGWPCRWLVGVASFFGGLHGATLPWPGGVPGGLWLLAVLALLGLLLTLRRTRPFVAVAAVVGMLVQIPVRSVVSAWPPSGWVFVACDIGQGDALVLNAAPHAAVVVDTGPEPVATDRCLRDLGVSDIPILFLTHFHLDHVGGISGAMRGRRVGRVETGPLYEPASGVGLVRDALRSRGLGMSSPAVGASFDVGALRLDVLGPAALFHDTHSDPNNSSLVMRATVAGIRILLSGDAEIEAQRALLDSGVDLRADVLKVWHHGSAYFDPAYVTAVRARTAVISVGLHNDYGHPSPLALAALARAGVPVSRTDLDGDVAVTVRDGQLATVRRGTAASTLGLRGARLAPEQVTSGVDARMPECQPVRSPPAICRARCPAPSCWSATRSFWSIARSARSPPPSGPSSPT